MTAVAGRRGLLLVLGNLLGKVEFGLVVCLIGIVGVTVGVEFHIAASLIIHSIDRVAETGCGGDLACAEVSDLGGLDCGKVPPWRTCWKRHNWHRQPVG
ncbi:MAG: hypothetical protein R3C12_05910 [Planctomycetaceae bacterium]